MSYVCNYVLLLGVLHEEGPGPREALREAIADQIGGECSGQGWFTFVDQMAFGPKAMETSVLVWASNYCGPEEVIHALRQVDWRRFQHTADEVQLAYCDENESRFTMVTIWEG